MISRIFFVSTVIPSSWHQFIWSDIKHLFYNNTFSPKKSDTCHNSSHHESVVSDQERQLQGQRVKRVGKNISHKNHLYGYMLQADAPLMLQCEIIFWHWYKTWPNLVWSGRLLYDTTDTKHDSLMIILTYAYITYTLNSDRLGRFIFDFCKV